MPKTPGKDDSWTVHYFAENGERITRENVLFYKIQEAIMDCSREAYEKGTACKCLIIV